MATHETDLGSRYNMEAAQDAPRIGKPAESKNPLPLRRKIASLWGKKIPGIDDIAGKITEEEERAKKEGRTPQVPFATDGFIPYDVAQSPTLPAERQITRRGILKLGVGLAGAGIAIATGIGISASRSGNAAEQSTPVPSVSGIVPPDQPTLPQPTATETPKPNPTATTNPTYTPTVTTDRPPDQPTLPQPTATETPKPNPTATTQSEKEKHPLENFILQIKVEDPRFGFTQFETNPDYHHEEYGSADRTLPLLLSLIHQSNAYLGSLPEGQEHDPAVILAMNPEEYLKLIEEGKAPKYQYPALSWEKKDIPGVPIPRTIDPAKGMRVEFSADEQKLKSPYREGHMILSDLQQWGVFEDNGQFVMVVFVDPNTNFISPSKYVTDQRSASGPLIYYQLLQSGLYRRMDDRQRRAYLPDNSKPYKRPEDLELRAYLETTKPVSEQNGTTVLYTTPSKNSATAPLILLK